MLHRSMKVVFRAIPFSFLLTSFLVVHAESSQHYSQHKRSISSFKLASSLPEQFGSKIHDIIRQYAAGPGDESRNQLEVLKLPPIKHGLVYLEETLLQGHIPKDLEADNKLHQSLGLMLKLSAEKYRKSIDGICKHVRQVQEGLTTPFDSNFRISEFTPSEAEEYLFRVFLKRCPDLEAVPKSQIFSSHYFGEVSDKKSYLKYVLETGNWPGTRSFLDLIFESDLPPQQLLESDQFRERMADRDLLRFVDSQELRELMQTEKYKDRETYLEHYIHQYAHSHGLDLTNVSDQNKIRGKVESVFSHEYFGFASEQDKKDFLENGNFQFLSRTDIQHIVEIAKKMMSQTCQGDTLVFFGNTPAPVGHAVSALADSDTTKENYRNIIFIPFSGTPNRIRKGQSQDVRNFTSPERVRSYMKLLEDEGLSPKNVKTYLGQIFIIDAIGSGAGPAFVLEELIREYSTRKEPIPDFKVMSLNQLKLTRTADSRHKDIFKGDGKLYLPSKDETHIVVPLIQLGMKSSVIEKLDEIPDHQRHFPSYNAMYWSAEYAERLKPDGSPYREVFLKYFDSYVQHLVGNKHDTEQ